MQWQLGGARRLRPRSRDDPSGVDPSPPKRLHGRPGIVLTHAGRFK